MKNYRKKPVVIQAVAFDGINYDEIISFTNGTAEKRSIPFSESAPDRERGPFLYIKTLEGEHLASDGDYIIKGIKGEFYPCKPDIFQATYDELN